MNDNPIRRAVDTRLSGLAFTPQMQADTLRRAHPAGSTRMGRKLSYSLSLILGAVGFVLAGTISNQYLLFIPFVLIGCAWAAMLAWPFTILTNSLKGGNIGAYLGLFNCSICMPQIVAAITGGWILSLFSTPGQIAPQYIMMIIAGVSLFIGALCVGVIKEAKSSKEKVKENVPVSEDL